MTFFRIFKKGGGKKCFFEKGFFSEIWGKFAAKKHFSIGKFSAFFKSFSVEIGAGAAMKKSQQIFFSGDFWWQKFFSAGAAIAVIAKKCAQKNAKIPPAKSFLSITPR